MIKLFAIRPYYERIKAQVFQTLSEVDAEVPQGWATDANVSDEDVVSLLAGVRPDALLVPYHATKDHNGERVNGLQTLRAVYKALPHLRQIPVLMPVSQFGRVAVMLRKQELLDEFADVRLLVLDEDQLGRFDTRLAIRDHLQRLPTVQVAANQ